MNLKISCAPNMKKASLDKLYHSLEKDRFNLDIPQRAMTNDDMERLING